MGEKIEKSDLFSVRKGLSVCLHIEVRKPAKVQKNSMREYNEYNARPRHGRTDLARPIATMELQRQTCGAVSFILVVAAAADSSFSCTSI